MPENDDQYRWRVAVHEAAHACACLCLGIPIIDITIDGDKPRLYHDDYCAPDGDIALQAMCILCLSGPVGEEIYCGGPNR